jgi:hypothetical protein
MRSGSRPRADIRAALGITASLTASAMVMALRLPKARPHLLPIVSAPSPTPHLANIAARKLNRAAGTLAASVLFDSAIEHYRGQFENKAMFTPLVTAALALAVSAHGTADKRDASHIVRDTIHVATGLVGLAGTAFHFYNVLKKPGRICWNNLFYGAPIGAPTAIGLSGMLGFLSERIRDTPTGKVPRIRGWPAGRIVGAVAGAGIVGTVAEAGLLHFRGSFHDPFMYLPVSMPPVAALTLMQAAIGPARSDRRATRRWLRAIAILGVSGTAFHAVGIGRDMGGWRNWQQNILNGPPLPAPPSFTGLALAGLAALDLLEDGTDA